MTRRDLLLAIVLVLLTGVGVSWGWRELTGQRDRLARARGDLAESKAAADRIEIFRLRPSLAEENERALDTINSLVETSARQAGVSPGSLKRIAPEPPVRLAETVYKEKPTVVLVKSVTLEELTKFLYRLIGDGELHARSLRLTSPSAEDTGERWNAEVTLTYLIYDPPDTELNDTP